MTRQILFKLGNSKIQRSTKTSAEMSVEAVKIYVCEDAVFAQLDDLADDSLQIGQVFACPFSTEEGALKFIHDATSP